MKNPTRLLLAALGCTLPASPLLAADITQTGSIPGGNTWNNTSFWGGNALVPENRYLTAPFGALETAFTVGPKVWQTAGNMRDSEGTSTFNGGTLVLNPDTRLLSKALGGATSTANIVLNGGFIHSAANAGGSATLAGTISFGAGINLGAIGVLANEAGPFTFHIQSTIVGGPDVTLQLVMNGSNRFNYLNLAGDLSGFSGTLHVTTADEGVAYGSAFSIASSAPLATLELAVDSPNFLFDLSDDVTFSSVIVGSTLLDAGTYSAADLDILAPGRFFGEGSITVVPEPSTFAMLGVAAAVLAAAMHRKRRA